VNEIIRRATATALFALCAVGAAASIAAQATAAEHACCHESSESATAPAPCDGFLPLTCCNAAALPGAEQRPAAPVALAIPGATSVPAGADAVRVAMSASPSAPRLPPARLSIVLQI